MGETESAERDQQYFAASARTGRRNALPTIDVEMTDSNAENLSERLSDMSTYCQDQKNNQPAIQNADFEKKPTS